MAEERFKKINSPEIGEYKGNPILSIPTEKGYPFSFGIAKAKAILKHLGTIEAFVQQNS